MQFLTNLLSRVPVCEVAPTLLAVLVIAGVFGRGVPHFKGILDILGHYWG